jgi:hypothetical protein
MTPPAKKRVATTISLPAKEMSGLGSGAKTRMDSPRQIDYRDASRLDGFLMQLTENGRVMELDKTDRAYRLLIWRQLGLPGAAKSWAVIFNLIRFLPRKLVAYILYTSAADWLVLKNESLKLAFTALANQNFTVQEVQQIMSQLESRMLVSRLEINAIRLTNWQHFLSYVEADTDVTTEVERAQQRRRELVSA